MLTLSQFLQGKSSVYAVNEFCTCKLGRPITKGDIQYTCEELGIIGGYQCTVTLKCLDDLRFIGEIQSEPKDAKTSAAEQVLQHFAEEMKTMPALLSARRGAKRTAEMAGLSDPSSVAASAGNGPDRNNKTALNNVYQQIIRRPFVKGEISYWTQNIGSGWLSKLQLFGLPEPLNQRIWEGEVCSKKQDAEQNVAGVALDALRGQSLASETVATGGLVGEESSEAGVGLVEPAERRQSLHGMSLADLVCKTNNKTDLSNLYSKIVKRNIVKGEINYSTNAVENGYQSKLVLTGLPESLNETEWLGEVCWSKSDAEQSVAGVALDALRGESLPSVAVATDSQAGEERLEDGGVPTGSAAQSDYLDLESAKSDLRNLIADLEASAEGAENGMSSADTVGSRSKTNSKTNSKTELNTLYGRLMKRPITKGEINYSTNAVANGWQCQLQLTGLPEPYNETKWPGEVCSNKSDAEQSAAGVVVELVSTIVATLVENGELPASKQGTKRSAQWEPSIAGSKKMKTSGNVCWDWNVKTGSFVKGRTEEEKDAAKHEYASWAEERLEAGFDPTGSNADSSDWWYCQVCLVCLCECSWSSYSATHKNGHAHRKKFIADGGYVLKPGVLRPDPQLQRPLEVGTIARFKSCAGFEDSRVLSLGEQDYSFSLKVARLQVEKHSAARIVATSYLAAHDPEETEVHVKDDGMRAHFSRRSLPSMAGALQKNIDAVLETGAVVLHSVDATNLPETLLNQYNEVYDLIVFPFPRASLVRGVQPKNPRLLRNFFRSVNEASILAPGGKIGIVLLRTQFADWDTACLALEAGFHLVDHAALPDGFYQGREMSGKIFDSWKQIGAEIYMFEKI